MRPFNVHILGCGSASPTTYQHPTAQVVQYGKKLFMIDCGEASQVRLREKKLSFEQIGHIFISHLHGDHCFGLPGLISSMGLLGRRNDLHLYGPKGLQEAFLPFLNYFCNDLPFECHVHVVDTSKTAVVYEDKSLVVTTLPLEHRVPCCGYYFQEKEGKRHIKPDMVAFHQIPKHALNRLALGEDFVKEDGSVVRNEWVTAPPTPPRSYAYCSDTSFKPSLAELFQGVDLLYHEATFAEAEKAVAEKTLHATASQAAQIACLAEAKRLLIGHFSARYFSYEVLLNEARAIFPNTDAAYSGMTISVKE